MKAIIQESLETHQIFVANGQFFDVVSQILASYSCLSYLIHVATPKYQTIMVDWGLVGHVVHSYHVLLGLRCQDVLHHPGWPNHVLQTPLTTIFNFLKFFFTKIVYPA